MTMYVDAKCFFLMSTSFEITEYELANRKREEQKKTIANILLLLDFVR